MDTTERLFAGDIIHEYEAHGTSVVGCGYGTVSFLAGGVLNRRVIL